MALDFPAGATSGDRVTLNSVIYEYDGAKWVTIRSLFDRGRFVAGTAADPGFSVSTDANTGLYAPGADQLAFTTGGVERVEFGTSEVVFNDGGIDYDFRIEGDADVNLVFADAGTDRIGIGTSTPTVKVDIEASQPYVTLKNTTEEDTDGGREVRIDFEGEQSGGEASTLARLEVSHDGAADDEKGKLVISTNDGSDGSAPTTAVTIDAAQKVTLTGDLVTNTINSLVYPDAGALSNRNLIINGAMTLAQRGTSSVEGGNATVDRFQGNFNGGAVTQSQGTLTTTADDASVYDLGFRNYFRQTNTTAATGNSDHRNMRYRPEAQDVATSGWNYTSSTSYITLSFWVRSSVAQEFYGYIRSENGTERVYTFSTGTLVADEWTKIEKTIPGDSSIEIPNDNTSGMQLFIANPFWGTAYTDASVTLDTWRNYDTSLRTPPFATTWASTAGATFDITGVQLEVGSKSTPFEHENNTLTKIKCQRYFQYIYLPRYMPMLIRGSNGLAGNSMSHPLPTPMRTNGSSQVTTVSSIRNFTGFNSTGSSTQSGDINVSTGTVAGGTDAEWYRFTFSSISNLSNNELQALANYTNTTNFILDAEL